MLCSRLGDFHLEMNVIIKNMERLMTSESSKDKFSLGYFAQLIGISHRVSNKPQQIKKVGYYEGNKQFFLTVGTEFLKDALKLYFEVNL